MATEVYNWVQKYDADLDGRQVREPSLKKPDGMVSAIYIAAIESNRSQVRNCHYKHIVARQTIWRRHAFLVLTAKMIVANTDKRESKYSTNWKFCCLKGLSNSSAYTICF